MNGIYHLICVLGREKEKNFVIARISLAKHNFYSQAYSFSYFSMENKTKTLQWIVSLLINYANKEKNTYT